MADSKLGKPHNSKYNLHGLNSMSKRGMYKWNVRLRMRNPSTGK